jgi:hypothetical protein
VLGRIDISVLGPIVGQALTPRINEGEAIRLTVRPLSADLAATTPTTMRYRIDDLNQGTAVLDWTSLVTGTSVNIVLTSAQNALRNCLSIERRQVVVEATDSDGPMRRTWEYEIADLQGIT